MNAGRSASAERPFGSDPTLVCACRVQTILQVPPGRATHAPPMLHHAASTGHTPGTMAQHAPHLQQAGPSAGTIAGAGTVMSQMRMSNQSQPHHQQQQQLLQPPHQLSSQHLLIQQHHPLHYSPAASSLSHQHRSYPTSLTSTPFTSPSGSATSSPYVSPSLSSSNSNASQLSLSHSSQQQQQQGQLSTDGALTVGSRIQIRGPESIHPKLHAYAYSFAEIVQLPVHPVTWYGVRLRDGKNVKLRKSSFDVVSVHSNGGSTVAAGVSQQQDYSPVSSQQSSPQHQPQPSAYSPYQFSHYQPSQAYNPSRLFSGNATPSTLQVPVGSSAKIVYASPSPSPSPLPPSSSSAASTTSASVATRDMAGLSVSTPQQSSRQPTMEVDPMASEEQYEDLDLSAMAGGTAVKQQSLQQQSLPHTTVPSPQAPTRHYPAHASPSTGAQPAPSNSLVLQGKRKPVPRALSPEDDAQAEEEDEDDEGGDAQNGEYDDQHQVADDGEYDSEASDDDTSSKKGGAGGKKRSSLANSKTASGNASSSKSARQRRGRGRALLGLNVVITNGRYKGETGLVVRGANGQSSRLPLSVRACVFARHRECQSIYA